jgi:hypothetical protein
MRAELRFRIHGAMEAVAVGRLQYEIIRIANDCGRPHDRIGRAAEITGEQRPPPTMLQHDHGATEDVAGLMELRRNAGRHLYGRVVIDTLKQFQSRLGVLQRV